MYKVRHVFTSRDGRLEPDGREFGISQESLDLLGDARSQLGGATTVFAKTEGGPSNKFRFFTRDNAISVEAEEKPESGWANHPISTVYYPDQGQTGWWNVEVVDAPSDVASGFGLPYGLHVSWFVIFGWEDGDQGEPETPGDGGPEIPPTDERRIVKRIDLYSDGTYEERNY